MKLQALAISRQVCQVFAIDAVHEPLLVKCCKRTINRYLNIASIQVLRVIGSVYAHSVLIDFHCVAGDIESALRIFHGMANHEKDIVVINAMMKGFINHSQSGNAMQLYETCHEHPSLDYTDVSHMLYLKACAKTQSFANGKRVIDDIDIVRNLDQHNNVLINAAIDFYANFSDVKHALQVFNRLHIHHRADTTSINSMMKCYINAEQAPHALFLFNQYCDIQEADDVSCVLYLKACTLSNEYEQGQRIIGRQLRGTTMAAINVYFVNTAIAFYTHFNDIEHALSILQSIQSKVDARDLQHSLQHVMKWYLQRSQAREALRFYHRFCSSETDNHDAIALKVLYLKACLRCNELNGAQTFIDRNYNQCRHSIEFVNVVIEFYAQNGCIGQALHTFQCIPVHRQSTAVLNTIMRCLVNAEQWQHVMQVYDAFPQAQQQRSDMSHTLYLKACKHVDAFETGKQVIGALIARCDEDEDVELVQQYSLELVSCMIDFYGHFGCVDSAEEIFATATHRHECQDAMLINVMMGCYVKNGEDEKAIAFFEQNSNGDVIRRDDATAIYFLKACMHSNDYDRGQQLIDEYGVFHFDFDHAQHLKLVHFLIRFYDHFGETDRAINIYESIPTQLKNAISTASMMSCFVNNNYASKAIALFDSCSSADAINDVSRLLYIKACVAIDDFERGNALIADCMQQQNGGQQQRQSVKLLNTVIDFYGNFNEVDKARMAFESIPVQQQNIDSMNAMMNIYNNNEQYNEALHIFDQIAHIPSLQYDAYCLSIALNACAGAMKVDEGCDIISGLLCRRTENEKRLQNPMVQAAILRFYAKTGQSNLAKQRFENIGQDILQRDRRNDGVIYSAMLDCYAKIGDIEQMLWLYDAMKNEYAMKITKQHFSIVLNGCGHCGEVERALAIFNDMMAMKKSDERIDLSPKCINAMVDCLARNHRLQEAEQLYHAFGAQFSVNSKQNMLASILAACRLDNDVSRAHRVFAIIVESIPDKDRNKNEQHWLTSAYIQMYNIYAHNEDVCKMSDIESEMVYKGIKARKREYVV